jgi:segregation and condensation protein B
MDQHLITRIVEAALLAANQPLTLAQLQALFPEDQPAPADSIEQALEALRDGCANRGVELVELASGFRFQVKADVHSWVARLWTERQTKYTRATLETLALIAYRQPITRGEIEQVRGVAVSSNIIKALEEREWIRVVGHRDVPGKPALFGTTKGFLDYFGLKRLDELPPLSELKDIGELEPQLPLDGAPIAAGGIARDAQAAAAEDAARAADADTVDAGGQNDAHPGGVAGDTREASHAVDADAHAGARSIVAETAGDGQPDDTEASDIPTEEPEAAPGMRAADENETGSESISSDADAITALTGQDNDSDPIPDAVETTTVPELQAASNDEPELQKND